MDTSKQAVVSVLGYDRKGIIAGVSRVLYENSANIVDISQTVISGFFNMVMIVDITDCNFGALSAEMHDLASELGVQIHVQRSDIFEAMHRI